MPARALLLINTKARRGEGSLDEARAALGARGIETLVPFDAEADATSDAIRRHAHEVDITASMGLSVDITEELSHEAEQRWGALAYVVAALRVLRRARIFRAEIRWEGRQCLSRSVQIVVGNGRYYGSALQVADDAAIDDHQLDLYTVESRHWWSLLTLAPALRRGRQGERKIVQAFRAPAFEVGTRRTLAIDIDGEVGARTPAHFRVLPSAIAVFASEAGGASSAA